MDSSWLERVTDFIASAGHGGGLLLAFPEYRPDLATAAAQHLGLRFFDFRAEEMSKLGKQAGSMGLDAFDDKITLLTHDGGLLVFNVDAILASKESAERAAWLQRVVRTNWPNPLVVPLTLFASEASELTSRIICFAAEELPEQGIVNRLIH